MTEIISNSFSKIQSNDLILKSMIFLLYTIQSLFYGFYISFPLTYTIVPDYQTLSIFAAAGLPYSFKFIMAPFQQRFYLKKYGKRKTWIMISLLIMAFIAFLMSKVVGKNEYQFEAALLLMISLFASALKDVSTDALAIQLIQNSATVSTISFISQQLGKTIALSLFLALISKGYWSDYGLNNSIIQGETFMILTGIFILLGAIFIHFLFKQHQIQKQQKKQSIWQIIRHYKHFINPKYELCRLSLLLIIMDHGIIYYSSTFQYELIRKSLIERQTLMLVVDISIIPSIIVCYLIGRYVNKNTLYKTYNILYIIQLFICIITYYCDFQTKIGIIIFTTFIKISSSLLYYQINCIMNQSSKAYYSAINITSLLSIYNLATNSAIQNQVIYLIGYDLSVLIGFSIAIIQAILLPIFIGWIKKGESIIAIKDQ